MNQKNYSITMPGQTGGGSRTTTTQFFEAGFTLGGRAVRVIDADPANAGYTESTGDQNSVKLINLIRDDRVADYIRDAATAGCCVLIDCGAGALSMAGEFVGGLLEAFETLRNQEYRHISFFPVNSNKAVVERILTSSIRRHSSFGKVIIGTTDLAGSNYFPEWIAAAGVPIIKIPVIPPGFIDVRMRFKLPLSAWLLQDDPDLLTAKAVFAAAVASLFAEPELSHLLTPDGRALLRAIEARGIRQFIFNPQKAAEATDNVLTLKAAESAGWRKALAAARSDPSSTLQPLFELEAAIQAAVTETEARFPNFKLTAGSRAAS